MSTVLLATDGSDLATAAMTRGIQLLGRDHRFIALHVVPPAYVPAAAVTPMDTHPTIVDPELERQIEREEQVESSHELAQLSDLLEVPLEPRVEVGDPGQTICTLAAELQVDLVVIGSHGHGWLQRVLMGSVSHHVLQHAPCPVLMVRLEATGPSPAG
ncbi:MAG: universal stress protein A-like protein [Acidimicrobiales bacterium]|nr:universal stress protein A-like protein [Acidimicrobiales bacterium]